MHQGTRLGSPTSNSRFERSRRSPASLNLVVRRSFMTPQELDARIGAFKSAMLRQVFWILLCPVAAFLFVLAYALHSRTPGTRAPFWPIATVVFGGAILMSLILTKLVSRASTQANLLCPHCGAPLGGYVKNLETADSRCPRCAQSLVESV
jgi:RsiW-degrading membrane proteinase PrsW (M82 family)